MRKTIKFAILLCLTLSVSDLFAQISPPNFLQGTWKMEGRESYEHWSKLSDSNLKGFSYQLRDGVMRVSEYLDITINDDKMVYIATVINQNQGQGIPFTLTSSDTAFVFENLKHDFPKRIIYQSLNENETRVTVSDGNKKGFSYKLIRQQTSSPSPSNNQGKGVTSESSKLLLQENWNILTNGTGTWTADNSAYKSNDEPYEQYQLTWSYDVGKTSLTGKLFGIIAGQEPIQFWEYKTFWDAVKKKAIVFQISPNGSHGISESQMLSDTLEQSIGVFHYSNGQSATTKHQSTTTPGLHTTISFSKSENGEWIQNRTYKWYPVPQSNKASSKVDTLQSGELMLKQEIVINAPVEKLWNAYTTAEAWEEWVTPIVEMDFKINGTIKSHYDPKAKIGDKGTIVIHILNYIPNKQITMQAEVAENFPEFMRGEEKNMYSIVDFSPVDKNSTKVTLYGIGYKNEQRWLDLMKFFIQGNEMTLNNLKKFVEQ